ncbi:hypothetical protein ABPG72_008821, partial [Tetrahymena utriculariae]
MNILHFLKSLSALYLLTLLQIAICKIHSFDLNISSNMTEKNLILLTTLITNQIRHEQLECVGILMIPNFKFVESEFMITFHSQNLKYEVDFKQNQKTQKIYFQVSLRQYNKNEISILIQSQFNLDKNDIIQK